MKRKNIKKNELHKLQVKKCSFKLIMKSIGTKLLILYCCWNNKEVSSTLKCKLVRLLSTKFKEIAIRLHWAKSNKNVMSNNSAKMKKIYGKITNLFQQLPALKEKVKKDQVWTNLTFYQRTERMFLKSWYQNMTKFTKSWRTTRHQKTQCHKLWTGMKSVIYVTL